MSMMNKIKIRLVNYLCRKLFNLVTEDDILRKNKDGKIVVGDKVLSNEEILKLKQQAVQISDTLYWQYLIADMKYIGSKKIFHESQTTDDLLFPKAILYVIDIIEEKMRSIDQVKTK